MASTAASTTSRSRRITAWIGPARLATKKGLGVDRAVPRPLQAGEVRVPALPVQLDGARAGPRARAGVLGLVVLEAVRQRDPGAVLRPRHRVADRLAAALDQARHREASGPALRVELDLDRAVQGLVVGVDDVGEDVEDGGPRLRLLAAEDGLDRASLVLVRPLVDDQHGLAAALVDGLGPGEEGDERHAVEPHIAEVPLVDADGLGGTTV